MDIFFFVWWKTDWLGLVQYTTIDIWVIFQDFSIVHIFEAEMDTVWPDKDPDADYDYYPGLIVQAEPETWKCGKYVSGSYKKSHKKGNQKRSFILHFTQTDIRFEFLLLI